MQCNVMYTTNYYDNDEILLWLRHTHAHTLKSNWIMVEMLANINNIEKLNVKAKRIESNKQYNTTQNRIMIEWMQTVKERMES